MEKQKQTLPFVEFKVDGIDPASDPQQSYKLTFDFNEICDAETATGFNLWAPLRNLSAMSAGQVRGLLFALLKTAHPQVTLKEAGALLTCDMLNVSDALWAVLDTQVGDKALFRSLVKISRERPELLAEMLSKLDVPEPPADAPVDPAPNA